MQIFVRRPPCRARVRTAATGILRDTEAGLAATSARSQARPAEHPGTALTSGERHLKTTDPAKRAKLLIRMVNGKQINIYVGNVEDMKIIFLKSQDIFVKPNALFYKGLRMFGQNILTLVDHEDWKKHHMLCSPAFSNTHMKYLADVAVKSTDLLREKWDTASSRVVSLHDSMIDATLDIIAKAGFNVDLGVFSGESKWMNVDRSKYQFSFRDALGYAIDSAVLVKAIIPEPLQFLWSKTNRAVDDFGRYIDELYEQKVKLLEDNHDHSSCENETHRLDLMSLLLTANESEEGLDEEGNLVTRQKMGYEQIRSNMFIFLAAGHETTATQLQWTLLELARHSEVYKKLQHEVDTLLPNKRAPTIEDYDKLSYTLSCIKESMRIHSPVPMVPKITTKTIKIREFKIPKDTYVWINFTATHRNPDYWDDPMKYNPERFYDPELAKKIKPMTWLPFSFGPRKCIGYQFSLVESVMILARLAQFYDVSFPDGCDPNMKIEGKAYVTIHPAFEQIKVTNRAD